MMQQISQSKEAQDHPSQSASSSSFQTPKPATAHGGILFATKTHYSGDRRRMTLDSHFPTTSYNNVEQTTSTAGSAKKSKTNLSSSRS